MIYTYSLYKISSSCEFSFCPSEYSRFKFGDGSIAKKFGEQLADGFIKDYLAVAPVNKQIVVISSPYSFIPTATFSMKNYFVYRLNRWLAENNFPVVQEAKVHRTITYKDDYGELNAEQRINLIKNDSFYIDKSFVDDKVLLFLDDVKITGGHEKMILKMIERFELKNKIFMLYFGELVNKSIPANVENFLNYYHVKSLSDLSTLVASKTFVINTRIVKYILNYEHKEFLRFIIKQSNEFTRLLYDMSIGNGYHLIDAYSKNLNRIKQFSQNYKSLHHGH